MTTLLLDTLLPVTPGHLFGVLTEPQGLSRWYSQQAEFDASASPGGRFEGKDGHFLESWTVEALTAPAALTVVWQSEADWYGEVALRVRFDLSPDPAGVRLSVTAEALSGPADRVRDALDEWRTALDALEALAEADFTAELSRSGLHITSSVPFPRDRVWQCLTQSQELQRWFWDQASLTPRAGTAFTLQAPGQRQPEHGTVLRCVPGRLLDLAWRDAFSTRRVVWRLEDDTRWTILDGPFEGEHAWLLGLCDVAWRSVQAALQGYLTTAAEGRVWDLEALRAGFGFERTLETGRSAEEIWSLFTDAAGSPCLAPFEAAGMVHLALAATPLQRLTWRVQADEGASIVSVTIVPTESGTRIRIHHWGFVGQASLRERAEGVWTEVLARVLPPPPPPEPQPGEDALVVPSDVSV